MTGRTAKGARLTAALLVLVSSATLIACGGEQATASPPPSPSSSAPPSEAAQSTDKAAQSTANLALAAVMVLMIDSDSKEAITPDALHSLEGSFDWSDGAATEPGVASYAFDGHTIAIAVLSGTGTCFRILRPAHGENVYTAGQPCDAREVLKAA